jgi:Dolichyl-phosphate-mannose-protein mannosyltransferase
MTALMLRAEAPTRVVASEASVSTTARRPRWPWWLALVAFAQYCVTAVWLTGVQGFLLLDGASRTITAQILVMSRDPHLGAMGFYWPPLPMFVRVPFVLLLAPFHKTLYAGSASSALLSALVIPVLAAIARNLRLSTTQTAVLLGLYAFNPVVVFYAANGMSEATFSLCLALSYLGYLRFSNSGETKDLRLLGLGLALGMMSRIEFVPITVAFIIACGFLIPRHRWKRALFLVALPPVYVFILWSWSASLLINDAFYWYHVGKTVGTTPTEHPWLPKDLTIVNIVGFVMKTSVTYAPVLVVLAALVAVRGLARKTWVGMVGVALVIPAFVAMQLVVRSTNAAQRYFSTMVIIGCVTSMWALSAVRHLQPRGRAIVGTLVMVSFLGGAIAVVPVNNDRWQSSLQFESAFFAPLVGRQPYPFPDYLAGVEELVKYLDDNLAPGDRVAMDSQGGLALLYTHHPGQFIVPEDRDFESIMSDPEGRFTYVIRPLEGLNSGYRIAIDKAMNSMQRGQFVLVKSVKRAELWKYELNPELSTATNTKGTGP